MEKFCMVSMTSFPTLSQYIKIKNKNNKKKKKKEKEKEELAFHRVQVPSSPSFPRLHKSSFSVLSTHSCKIPSKSFGHSGWHVVYSSLKILHKIWTNFIFLKNPPIFLQFDGIHTVLPSSNHGGNMKKNLVFLSPSYHSQLGISANKPRLWRACCF